MLKLIALCALSSLAGVLATIEAISTPRVAEDRCRIYGYVHCLVIDGIALPETSDPRARRELTRLVRQVSRDRL